jgi:hypothetical protein
MARTVPCPEVRIDLAKPWVGHAVLAAVACRLP